MHGLAVIKASGGMHGIQHEMRIFAQSIEQSAARLLQGHCHRPSRKAPGQGAGPLLDGFRRVL